MKIYIQICLWILTLVASGCGTFKTEPSNNFEFNPTITLQDLEGIYQNRGEEDFPSGTILLSTYIWPDDKKMNHYAIDAINVRKTSDSGITVQALEKNKVRNEATFFEGADFEIKAGRIHLKTKVELTPPFFGPTYSTAEFGLDRAGHGKLREKSGFAGLVFVVPVAVAGTSDVRFVRIGK